MDSWAPDIFRTIGILLLPGYSAARYIPTATTTVYGSAATTKKDGPCLESKMPRIATRLLNRYITTTANAFVRLMAMNNVSRILYQASDWLLRTARLLQSTLAKTMLGITITSLSRLWLCYQKNVDSFVRES